MIKIMALILLAAACAPITAIKEAAPAIADKALETAEWGVCVAATRGALHRRYTSTEQQVDYDAFCGYD